MNKEELIEKIAIRYVEIMTIYVIIRTIIDLIG